MKKYILFYLLLFPCTLMAQITGTFGIVVVEWKWDFGDSTGFYGKDPPQHGYLASGNYTVQLSVTGSNSCSDQKAEKIQVYHGILKKPELYAYGPNLWYLVCSNDTENFYKWYYNGNYLFNEDSYIHVANQEMGEYQVAISSDDKCYVFSDRVWIPTTGELTVENEKETIIYPNPNNGHFYL